VCTVRVTGLRFVAPDAGTVVGPATTLRVVVEADTASAGVTLPGAVTLTATNGAYAPTNLPRSGATTQYSGEVTLAGGAMTGPTTLTATMALADAGVSGTLDLQVDTTPPTVGLLVSAPPVRPSAWREATKWRRDERPLVLVHSTEALAGATVRLSGVAGTSKPASACTGAGLACPATEYCECFEVDMAAPPLPGLEGTFVVEAEATDGVGLMGRADGGVPVTRLRWQVQPGGATANSYSAPAIGSDGTVYFGTQAGATGSLYGVKPDGTAATGALGAGVSVGAVQSVAVARTGLANEEYVYFSANDSMAGYVRSVKASDGSLAFGHCNGVGNSATYAGLALVKDGQNVFALGVINATGTGTDTTEQAQLCRHAPGVGTPTPAGAGLQYNFPAPSSTQPVTHLLAVPTGATSAYVFFGAASARVWRGTVTNGVWGTTLTAVTPDAGLPAEAALTGLAPGDGMASRLLASGGNNLGGLHRVDVSGGTQASVGSGIFSPAAVASATSAWAGSGTNLARYDGILMPLSPVNVPNGVLGSPVLGNRGGVYAVSRTGQVVLNGAVHPLPTAAGYQAGTVVASPTLDCNRLQAQAGRPGVLYFLDTAGRLTAVLVDDEKLDTNALWPKYQRTAGNAGNTNTTDFPLNPGCP
jgi:hypothetical protein